MFIGDQMITDGYALFENGQVRDGYILFLDQHLDRLFKGIKAIKLENSVTFTRESITEIISKTVALSGCKDCSFRYYLSAGVNG